MVDEAIHQLVDAKWRTLYEGRLRRQAALFAYAGRSQDADLVRAVAAVLHPNSSVPPERQAFLRAMMRFSIEQGPIRMMAAALESAPFGTGPLDLLLDH